MNPALDCTAVTQLDIWTHSARNALNMRVTLKIMSPVLWCCDFMTHDVRDRCWCYDSRGWTFPQIEVCISNGVSLSSSTRKKKSTHWHSLMLAECLWKPNSGCEYPQVLGVALQQWWQWCERQASFCTAMQILISMACRLLLSSGKNAQLVVVTMLENTVS